MARHPPYRRIVMLSAAGLLLAALCIAGRYAYGEWRARRELAAAHGELARYHYGEACEHVRRAAAFWTGRGEVQLEAARLCRRAEQPDEGRPYLEAARKLLGDTEEVRLEQQLILAQKGGASEFAEHALEERAVHDLSHRDLIREALLCGALATFRIDRAKSVADAWLNDSGDDPRAWFWRGLAREMMGGYQEDAAIADFRRAVECDPDYDEARTRLGRLLLKKKNAADARPHFEELHRRHPDNVGAMVGLARCLLATGDAESGRTLLDAALSNARDDAEALRERGILALDEAHPAEALPMLRRSYERVPQDPYTSYNLMKCLRQLGRDDEAKEQEARNARLVDQQARLLNLTGEFQRRPRDTALTHEIGALYLDTGRPEYEQTGLWWMQKTLEIDPSHAPTLQVLADYFARKDMPDLAARFRKRLRGR